MSYHEQELARVEALYRAHGMTPTWTRVWSDGVDVTAEPPSSWGPPWSWYVAGRRGPEQRAYWLRRHAEAVVEGGGEPGW